jgi:hypothetical protein
MMGCKCNTYFTAANDMSEELKPLDYEPSRRAWDVQPPGPPDRMGGAVRLIGSTIVIMAGAVLLGMAADGGMSHETERTLGIITLIVGLVGFVIEYFGSRMV